MKKFLTPLLALLALPLFGQVGTNYPVLPISQVPTIVVISNVDNVLIYQWTGSNYHNKRTTIAVLATNLLSIPGLNFSSPAINGGSVSNATIIGGSTINTVINGGSINSPVVRGGNVKANVINVSDYLAGKVPFYTNTLSDGVNLHGLPDMTTNIQNALNAAGSGGGYSNELVFNLPGTYRITTNLWKPAKVWMNGMGWAHSSSGRNSATNGYTVIWEDNTNSACLVCYQEDWCYTRLQDLELNGYTNPIANSSTMRDDPNSLHFAEIGLLDVSSTNNGFPASGNFFDKSLRCAGFRIGHASGANTAVHQQYDWGGCDIGFWNVGNTNIPEIVGTEYDWLNSNYCSLANKWLNIVNPAKTWAGFAQIDGNTFLSTVGGDRTNAIAYVIDRANGVEIIGEANQRFSRELFQRGGSVHLLGGNSELDFPWINTNPIVLIGSCHLDIDGWLANDVGGGSLNNFALVNSVYGSWTGRFNSSGLPEGNFGSTSRKMLYIADSATVNKPEVTTPLPLASMNYGGSRIFYLGKNSAPEGLNFGDNGWAGTRIADNMFYVPDSLQMQQWYSTWSYPTYVLEYDLPPTYDYNKSALARGLTSDPIIGTNLLAYYSVTHVLPKNLTLDPANWSGGNNYGGYFTNNGPTTLNDIVNVNTNIVAQKVIASHYGDASGTSNTPASTLTGLPPWYRADTVATTNGIGTEWVPFRTAFSTTNYSVVFSMDDQSGGNVPIGMSVFGYATNGFFIFNNQGNWGYTISYIALLKQ